VTDDGQALAEAQREHWQGAYSTHPGMYGEEPSTAAVHAADVFRTAGAQNVLELGAGHGRDALYFARKGFAVQATDFSPVGLQQLQEAARAQRVDHLVSTAVHDARDPLPLQNASVDAVFAHMLLCMALSTKEIHALVGEIRRVLHPGGTFVYTVRHTGDAHYGAGTPHGDGIFEHGGFAVHFFPRSLIDALASGWIINKVHPFRDDLCITNPAAGRRQPAARHLPQHAELDREVVCGDQSAAADAVAALHLIVDRRLARDLTTVVDATSLMVERVHASGEALVERVACGACAGSGTLGEAAA
jgi:SAM-dependent methyltransferase